MKKLIFSLAIIATTATLFSSCKKDVSVPLVDQLEGQSTYLAKHISINDAEISSIISFQVGNNSPKPIFAEISVNDGNASQSQQRVSHLYTDLGIAYNQQGFTISKTNSGSAVTLLFSGNNNNNSCYVGRSSEWNTFPEGLKQSNLLIYNSNGSTNPNGTQDGQYTLSPSILSGTYMIEKTTFGFLLTMTHGSTVATIELEKAL